jgi:diaminopimelate epimerase
MRYSATETQQHIERFEQLIRVMENLPEHERTKHFDMRHWGLDTTCGTSMCAAGFCGIDAWFIEQGFTLKNNGEEYYVSYKNLVGWVAIRRFSVYIIFKVVFQTMKFLANLEVLMR